MLFSDEDAVKRFELGLEEYEVVEEEYGPVEGHTVPSANKKLKMRHDADDDTDTQQVRHIIKARPLSKDLGISRVPGGNPKKRKRVSYSVQMSKTALFTDFPLENPELRINNGILIMILSHTFHLFSSQRR